MAPPMTGSLQIAILTSVYGCVVCFLYYLQKPLCIA